MRITYPGFLEVLKESVEDIFVNENEEPKTQDIQKSESLETILSEMIDSENKDIENYQNFPDNVKNFKHIYAETSQSFGDFFSSFLSVSNIQKDDNYPDIELEDEANTVLQFAILEEPALDDFLRNYQIFSNRLEFLLSKRMGSLKELESAIENTNALVSEDDFI